MDVRGLPEVLILICSVIYVSAVTKLDKKSLETPIVGRDGNPDGVQDYRTVVTSPNNANYKLSYADYETTWRNYKLEHDKRYSSTREENRRFAIFMENVKTIEAHNKNYHLGQSKYWMDINRFSDWTQEEFEEWLGPQEMHSRSKRESNTDFLAALGIELQAARLYLGTSDDQLPEAIDWRDKGFVTEVKNQGDCGSCYAFSTTGAVEGQLFRRTGQLISLSEQQIMDCSTGFGNNKCKGGNRINSYRYIIAAGGLQSEDTYPYLAKNDTCKFNQSLVVAQVENYNNVIQTEAALKSAVGLEGPVSVAIYASEKFKMYDGGIFDEPNCTARTLHAMLVVGYGSSNGSDYWIVKNCWGKNWRKKSNGDGYIKMARNKEVLGTCGIAKSASFPIVPDPWMSRLPLMPQLLSVFPPPPLSHWHPLPPLPPFAPQIQLHQVSPANHEFRKTIRHRP